MEININNTISENFGEEFRKTPNILDESNGCPKILSLS